jgi:hypothetical protein
MSCFGQETFFSHKANCLLSQLLLKGVGKLKPPTNLVEQRSAGLITT